MRIDEGLAKKLLSRDNACQKMNETMLFGIRKHKKFEDDGKKHIAEKKAVQCAIDYAKKMQHVIVVKFPMSKYDHWYGSYEILDDLARILRTYRVNSFEIITVNHPKGDLDGSQQLARFFHEDVEYDPATLIRPAGMPVPTDEEVIDALNEYICEYASTLCGHEVSRKVQLSISEGVCNDPKWAGIDKKSCHGCFEWGFENQEREWDFKTALHNRIMQERPPNMTYMMTETNKSTGQTTRTIKSILDPAPYQKNQS